MAAALGVAPRYRHLPSFAATLAYDLDAFLSWMDIYVQPLHLLGEANWHVGLSIEEGACRARVRVADRRARGGMQRAPSIGVARKGFLRWVRRLERSERADLDSEARRLERSERADLDLRPSSLTLRAGFSASTRAPRRGFREVDPRTAAHLHSGPSVCRQPSASPSLRCPRRVGRLCRDANSPMVPLNSSRSTAPSMPLTEPVSAYCQGDRPAGPIPAGNRVGQLDSQAAADPERERARRSRSRSREADAVTFV